MQMTHQALSHIEVSAPASIQMTDDALVHIEAIAASSPAWMLTHLIKLVTYGLNGVTAEVKERADTLLLKLNRLAEEAVAPRTTSAQPAYLEPALALPDVSMHRKAA